MKPSKNVFVSYAPSDKAKIRSILTHLQKHAPSRLNIANVQGQVPTKLDLRSAIQSQIAKSDEVVVLWTKDGAASSFVNDDAAANSSRIRQENDGSSARSPNPCRTSFAHGVERRHPGWSPDGRRVFFAATAPYTYGFSIRTPRIVWPGLRSLL